MKRLVFVKFGGSLITDKSKEEKANLDKINNLSLQIKEAVAINKDLCFLIGNGAGSFGHIQVKKYQLKDKIKTSEQKLGFAKVSTSVSYLNYLVVLSLINHNLPAISIKPSSIAIKKNDDLIEIYTKTIIAFLEKNYFPVVYGDMILDEKKGGAVLSTDVIFYELIKEFRKKNILIEKVIFCGATDGVIDLQGKTIKKINRENYSQIQKVFYKNPYVDVTGGMKKKVEIALKIAKIGIKSYIINGKHMKENLLNNRLVGTLIT